MLHNLIFIGLTVLLAFSFPLGVEPAFYDPVVTGWGAAGLVALSALSGALASRLGARPPAAFQTSRPLHNIFGFFTNPPVLARGCVLLWYALLTFGLNWPCYVQCALRCGGIVVVEKLLVLLPAVVGLMASFVGSCVGEASQRREGVAPLAQLVFQVRILLGFALLPVLCILIVFDVLESIPAVADLFHVYRSLYFVTSALLLLGAYALAPLILRAAFRTRPLETWLQARASACTSANCPQGHATSPLLEDTSNTLARLRTLCHRFGMPRMRLLVWETGAARIPNAGMVGLLGGFRYVLLSDVLLEIMTPEELETVVGHELGHAKHKHLLIYFVSALAFTMLGQFVFSLIDSLDTPPTVELLFSAMFVLAFWKAVLGGLSRIFESQADLEGARAVGSPLPFTSAMEKIAATARIDRHAPNWLYRSVAARISFVWSVFQMPEEERQFHALIKRIQKRVKQVALLAILGLVWMAADDLGEKAKRRSELERIRIANAHFRAGCRFYQNREYEQASLEFRLVVALVPQWAPGKILLADTLRELGLVRQAWEIWQSAARDEPPHPIHRIGLRQVKEALLATGYGAD